VAAAFGEHYVGVVQQSVDGGGGGGLGLISVDRGLGAEGWPIAIVTAPAGIIGALYLMPGSRHPTPASSPTQVRLEKVADMTTTRIVER
jgi:hypothetical protein